MRSDAQKESELRYQQKLRQGGYKSNLIKYPPQVADALEYLRQNRRGGFNLTQAVQELILQEAAKEGYDPEK